MNARSLPTKLPSSLYKFFWDVDAPAVNPREHPTYVIARLLDKGNLEAARWVLASFPRGTIVQTLRTVKDFSPWNGTFWAHYLEIKKEDVACLRPSYRQMRKQLWPY